MNNKIIMTGDLMDLLDVPRHQIDYAIECGVIDKPSTAGGRRYYDDESIEKLQLFFARKHEAKMRRGSK